ncbi:hypothetical protein EI94DRAFT_255052 [Lactarius quietus]|nr:hypothetical protein EI94DRAFT_255052 [Lactarius quietus]
MPWPEFITLQFELVNEFATNDSEYYGPFNALLNELFPASEYYQIAPLFGRTAGSIYPAVVFLITRRKVPVFLIGVQNHVAYDTASSRKAADGQMRETFLDYSAGSLPNLYGLSIFGTRFCIYEYTAASRSLTPPRIDPHPDVVTLLPTRRLRRDGFLISWNRMAKLG